MSSLPLESPGFERSRLEHPAAASPRSPLAGARPVAGAVPGAGTVAAGPDPATHADMGSVQAAHNRAMGDSDRAGAAHTDPAEDAGAALRFLQRWHALAHQTSQRDGATFVVDRAEAARGLADQLQWQLVARPQQALQAQGQLDPARVAQWLQH